MAKLEELSELLVHELDQFSASIEKLEKVNKDGLKVDLSDLNREFQEHRVKTEKMQERMFLKVENMEHSLKKSKVYPNLGFSNSCLFFLINGTIIKIIYHFFSKLQDIYNRRSSIRYPTIKFFINQIH